MTLGFSSRLPLCVWLIILVMMTLNLKFICGFIVGLLLLVPVFGRGRHLYTREWSFGLLLCFNKSWRIFNLILEPENFDWNEEAYFYRSQFLVVWISVESLGMVFFFFFPFLSRSDFKRLSLGFDVLRVFLTLQDSFDIAKPTFMSILFGLLAFQRTIIPWLYCRQYYDF